jgi:hypothetical protein
MEENNIVHSVNFLTVDAEQNLVSFLATHKITQHSLLRTLS